MSTTIDTAAARRDGTGSLRVLRDTWIITQRDLGHWVAQPAPVLVSLLFPVLTVLMFGYLFGGALSVPGGGSYREFLLPGMFAMTMVFGMEMTMAAVVTDAGRGITDRFRSLPMASSAVLLGRSTADMLNAAAGLAVMIGCGLAVGWQARGPVATTLAAIGLLLLLRFALIWVGSYLGLLIKGPEAVTAAQILVWPLGFLSNAFVTRWRWPWPGPRCSSPSSCHWRPAATVGSATDGHHRRRRGREFAVHPVDALRRDSLSKPARESRNGLRTRCRCCSRS